MSKSKGNFFTLREIAAEVPYDVIRFFILSAHYRSPINFSRELMAAAGNGLDRIKNCARSLVFITENVDGDEMTADEKELSAQADNFRIQLEKAMDDDFNTADAVTAVFDLVSFANRNVGENSTKAFASDILDRLLKLCDILGIVPIENTQKGDTAKIEELIAKRTAAKKAKDFASADAIRSELLEMGVVIEDTRAGVRWSYAK